MARKVASDPFEGKVAEGDKIEGVTEVAHTSYGRIFKRYPDGRCSVSQGNRVELDGEDSLDGLLKSHLLTDKNPAEKVTKRELHAVTNLGQRIVVEA